MDMTALTDSPLIMSTLVIGAYLFGSLSTAIIVCQLFGYPDPRSEGSRNPGTTNVLRIAGKPAAAMTLAGDAGKGVIPVIVAQSMQQPPVVVSMVAFAALLGHLFPIFFRFQGGKGVATALGVAHAISWPAGLCIALTWLIVAALTRYSSLAAITSWTLAPMICWYFSPHHVVGFVLISVCLIGRHKQNIRQLLAGQERKIGDKQSNV